MQNFFVTLLICSATMSAVALFYMAITPLLAKRYSIKWRYYAWLVIVIGLIIPFRPHFDTAIITVDMPAEAATPIVQTWNGTPDAMPNEDTTPSAPTLPSITWEQIAVAVWLTGMIGVLAYHAIRHYRFLKMVRRWSKEVTDARLIGILNSLTDQMGISAARILESSCVPAPMMVGFLTPVILLPKTDFSNDELAFILKHELVHFKRKDLWYKCAVLATTAIHWFNPVVYLMAKEIGAQCELSCDEEVLRSEDADTRQQYSETIIGVIRNQCKVKTALSTNFYGGKKGMKKRIFSIMDTTKKKTGFAIICGVLIVTLGTGFAFAANATASAPQANGNTIFSEAENAYNKSAVYEKYRAYDLTYDKETDNLYYNGELVRYFEDWYPVGEGGSAGTDYFNENGTIDVHGVRDLSQIVRNADGSYDPSGKLIGVEPYSQAEFDARDIDILKNPPQAYTSAYGGGEASTDELQNPVGAYGGGSNFILAGESKENFKIYAEFGLTYDDDDVFRYNGKTVRRFADLGGALSFTRAVENDYDKSVDLTAVRDTNGNLIGLSLASKDEFDQRTALIEQSQKEWEEYTKNNPNVTTTLTQ